MLAKVHAYWIKGVLEQSLHGAALIALGLQEQPDAVANPWWLVIQEADQSTHPLLPGARITQVFDDAGGELLILGEPGSGKTTLLLELARDLLDRAQKDDTLPMPVVFNLSSWAVRRQSIVEWMIEELRTKYQVPSKLAQTWVNDDKVLPLLDGLDEIVKNYRTACMDAINAYRYEHIVPIVVSSRSTEYLCQTSRILMRKAVVVQPLSSQQIDDYISSAERKLAALREDPALQELAVTPLMLSVLTVAYHDLTVEEILREGLITTRRQVFEQYTKRVLERREGAIRYSRQKTMYWLVWLAKQLTQHNQTVFYIERMQPGWVSKDRKQSMLSVVMAGLVSVLLFGLSSVLIFGIDGLLFGSQQQSYFVGAIGSLCIGPWTSSSTNGEQLIKTRRPHDGWPLQLHLSQTNLEQSPKQQHMKVMSTPPPESDKLVCTGSTTVSYSPVYRGTMQGGLIFALLFGLFGTLIGVVISVRKRSIQLVEVVKWQWEGRWRILLTGLLIGLSLGLLIRELFGFLSLFITMLIDIQNFPTLSFAQEFYSTSQQYIAETLFGFKDTILFGGMGLLLRGVMSRISSELMDEHKHYMPNEGILRSAQYAAFSCLIIMLVCEGSIGLIEGPIHGLFFGLIVGIVIGLTNGGIACVQHLLLRVRLWYEKVIPWNYPRFLDHAADRILLRKVGGGYIFIHRLLLEYFASLDTTQASAGSTKHT